MVETSAIVEGFALELELGLEVGAMEFSEAVPSVEVARKWPTKPLTVSCPPSRTATSGLGLYGVALSSYRKERVVVTVDKRCRAPGIAGVF